MSTNMRNVGSIGNVKTTMLITNQRRKKSVVQFMQTYRKKHIHALEALVVCYLNINQCHLEALKHSQQQENNIINYIGAKNNNTKNQKGEAWLYAGNNLN